MGYVALSLLFDVCLAALQPLVNIPGLGSLQGTTSQSYFTNRTIYEFKGIPFAERPVRFLPPEKKAPWDTVLNATSFGCICPQSISNIDEGDLEDCLFLNVFTPKMDDTSKLPVLIYIHGGGFVAGSNQLPPGFFLEHDIVLVTPQYRLGPLGFLSLGTDEIPGNAGMYDQVMALQWTYDNIQYFGGDPEKITVSGDSAGAASAALLCISPLSQGLIKHAIVFSGTSIAFWAVGSNPVKDSLKIAKFAGCEPTEDVASCLKSLDPLALTEAYVKYQTDSLISGHSGSGGNNPVVDGRFLVERPLETMNRPEYKGRPIIFSVVKHEGVIGDYALYNKYLMGHNLTNDIPTLKYGIPDILLSYADLTDNGYNIGTAIKDVYFKPEEFGNYTAMKAGIVDFFSSAYFKGPARKMAELNSLRGGASYLMTFNYCAQGFNSSGVITHGNDHVMIFPKDGFSYTNEDLALVQKLTAAYTTFMETGTPSGVSWDQYSLESGKYLIVDNEITQGSQFEHEQYTIAEQEGLYK